MNILWLLLFLLLPLVGISYASWHVWVLLPLSTGWKSIVLALGLLSVLLLFYVISPRFSQLPTPLARIIYNIGTSSIIVLLYVVMIFLALDLARLCGLLPRSVLYANGWTATALVAVVSGIFCYGYLNYRHKVRVPLVVESAKPLSHPYRIVMASDLHLGYHNNRKELARWVDMINKEHPDLVLIAGDIIDRNTRPLLEEDMAAEFRRIGAPVYACLGNHEYYSGQPEAQQFYSDADIHLLRDEVAEVDSSLVIIGRDDRTNPQRHPVAELMADVDTTKFIILLDHQPHDLEEAEQSAVDFQLSGHTHRGQVWPISWATDLIFECSWGSHRRGRTWYYVSSGLGIWGGRYRIGTQSEYVVAEIK